MSTSLGTLRGSDARSRTLPFSLSRFLPSHRRTKSQLSLDSEAVRSDGGACGSSPPNPGNVASSSPPLMLTSFHQLHSDSTSSHISNVNRSQSEVHQSLEGIPQNKVLPEESNMDECSQMSVEDDQGVLKVECPVCLVDKSKDHFPEISTCHHRCCSECLREYFRIEIMESRLAIACPECSELFHPNDIRAIVQDGILFEKYEDFMVRRVLAMDSDTRWCPAPDCGYAVIASGCACCPKLKCERVGCNTFFCYHCKQYWHPNQTCDAARAERSPNIRSASVSYSQESGAQNEIKSCPRCGAYIVKMDDGSCNHMTCAVCGAGFCWLCMKEISDLHYLSPSGCTFWGRKPWSRKKKILWQLGTLVGAPVGITLVAGIAVPAMIIGIPVWVGRKIHYRYDGASKHKRNLAITGGVAASILAAPIIAGLAVGIGVPILLAYVYGVVPFSLCRSGGCGVTTTNTGGVRFEFDEHDESNTQGPYAGDNHSIETAPNVANPSIAPSIGDASLGMTNSLSASGSHMDRAGVLRDDSDRDSSSHRAIAGNSNNGSLCSATYGTQHHKLEVQADISEHAVHCERSSMGGESYSMSFNDDASTKALAGSIVSHRDKDGISLCSRHFDGAAGPLAYPEETSEKEDEECASSSSGGGHQQMGSSSCPTSPHLRKASPAPSEDARSTRGKKCTRFMDQVSEIESKIDCVSIGSIVSNTSTSPDCDGASMTATAYSTLSLTATTTSTTTKTALASCESLMSEGKAESVANMAMGKAFNLSCSGRVKAESTSVLMDCAESRRSEMAGTWKKSGSSSRDDLNPTERSVLSRRKGSSVCNREHRSQPGNLSDISEMKGMPSLHAAGCSDLLAVIDTSCENVFLDKTSHAKVRLMSASSYSSSSGDPVEFLTDNFAITDSALLEACAAVEDGEFCEYDGFLKDTLCSLSDIDIRERVAAGNTEPVDSQDNLRSQVSNLIKENAIFASADGEKTGSSSSVPVKCLLQDGSKKGCETEKRCDPTNLCQHDVCISRTNVSSDSSVAVYPLPDVELPVMLAEADNVMSFKCVRYRPTNPSKTFSQNSPISSCSLSISPTLPSATATELAKNQNTDCHYSKKSSSVWTFSASAPSTAVTTPESLEGKIRSDQTSPAHLPAFQLYSEAKPRKAATVFPVKENSSGHQN